MTPERKAEIEAHVDLADENVLRSYCRELLTEREKLFDVSTATASMTLEQLRESRDNLLRQMAVLQRQAREGERLQQAIRQHRDEKGDDRCWMDDERLYAVLPEGYTPPARDSSVELENCRRFIACRRNPATEYVSPQRRIEELQEWRDSVSVAVKNLPEFHTGQWAGDKEGWGYHFEVVNWLSRERERLQAANAELLAGLSEVLSGAPRENVKRPVVCSAPTAESVPNECECYSCELLRYGETKRRVAELVAKHNHDGNGEGK
jgi:hypothetical protein